MEFHEWLAAAGIDPATVEGALRAKLQAAWRAEQSPGAHVTADAAGEPVAAQPRQQSDGRTPDDALQAIVDGARAENERQMAVVEMVQRAVSEQPTRIAEFERLGRMAIDSNWSVQKAELEFLRGSRAAVRPTAVRAEAEATPAVVEAAVCKAGGLRSIERHFDAQTLEAADRRFGRAGLHLQDLIAHFAQKNGYRERVNRGSFNNPTVLKAAFRAPEGGDEMYAGVAGPSTYSLPTTLSNVANRFMRSAFETVDAGWREVAAIGSVSDFKQRTTISLLGDFIYEKLPPGGEIQHASATERTWTNQADTYARMFGIDRRDLINDDLGILTGAARRIGRGAGLKLNDIFWAEFLDNAAFFAAGNNNVTTGAGSALSLTALAAAVEKFRLQTDPDGYPLGVMPRILLVPPALETTAKNLMNSTQVIATNTGTTTTTQAADNPFAGAFRVVTSPYLSNSAYTGNSTTAWYLLADPNDLPVIEVVFLNGQQTPTVETTEADFNTLGIAMRGYIDAGVALQEFRGGVRAAGA